MFKAILKIFLAIFLFLVIVVIGIFIYFAKDLPRPEEFGEREIVQSTKIYDRTGEVLLYQFGEIKRTIVKNEEISPFLIKATIVTEDTDFYKHFGIDFKSIIRALLHNFFHRNSVQGGSTITQQLVKNALLTPEGEIPKRTLSRKFKEIILSIEIERKYSKEEILNFYLNQISYGFNVYGIEETAHFYFQKKAKDLTLAESALLAALPKAPSYYFSHPEQLKSRQEYILDRMAVLGYISSEELKSAKEEKVSYAFPSSTILAPHFVFYVQQELINYFQRKYNFAQKEAENFIQKSGFKVYTTLDWELEELAEKIIKERVEKNEKWYLAENAALVAIDPKSGEILSMVGSRDWFDENIEGKYNVAISPHRQPGSSFKPFAYAAAFKKGYTPDTIIWDVETNFPGWDSFPSNYDNKFRGPLTMRQALAQSLNIPSIKVLYLAGVNETINTAKDLGITTLNDRENYGLSLVLGGGEVKLLDEVASYGVFATEGLKHPPSSILYIENLKGEIIEEFKSNPIRVLDPQIARLINDILSDNQARSPMFGIKNNLILGDRPIAAKTGTTQEFKDAWTVGYTPSLVSGVWVGNNDGSLMYKGSGIRAAAPIWNEFMKKAYLIKSQNPNHKSQNEFVLPEEIEEFKKPEPMVTNKLILNGRFENVKIVEINKTNGKLATSSTPPCLIKKKKYIEPHSILYYVEKDNPQGIYPQEPNTDPQFLNWEEAIKNWIEIPDENFDKTLYQKPPTEYDDDGYDLQENNLPFVSILSPEDGERFNNSDIIEIKVSATAPLGIKKIDLIFGGKIYTVLTKKIKYEHLFKFNLKEFKLKKENPLLVRVYDIESNKEEDKIEIIIE